VSALKLRRAGAPELAKRAAPAAPAADPDPAQRVRERILERAGPALLAPRDAESRKRLEELVSEAVAEEFPGLLPSQRKGLEAEIRDDILGYGPVQGLLDDPEVTEVMVNGLEVWFEKRGKLFRAEDVRFRSEAHVRAVAERMVASAGRRVDESCPLCDARLPDGSRVNVVLPPVAVRGVCITVRKFRKALDAEALLENGTVTQEALGFLAACVRAKLNIVVSGGTGTGKTTLLNVLSSFVPPDERIVTVEDAAELQLQQPHVVPLEARPPNPDGRGEITIRALVRNALRMRPDRIIVGECRGAEALDMLQAMNTGHEGSMTTVHANSARDCIERVVTMALMAQEGLSERAVREQVASAFHVIVQLERARDGRRRVCEVCEVARVRPGEVGVAPLFALEGGELRRAGREPAFAARLAEGGRLP
jgi:pilus assembly protein CpaF